MAVVFLLTLNLSIVAYHFFRQVPHEPNMRPPRQENELKHVITDKLHLNEEQVVQYEKLIKEHQRAIQALDDSIRIAKNNLYQSLTFESFDGKDSLIHSLGVLQSKIELSHYDHFASIRKICKPEQLEDFNKLTHDLASFFALPKKERPKPKD